MTKRLPRIFIVLLLIWSASLFIRYWNRYPKITTIRDQASRTYVFPNSSLTCPDPILEVILRNGDMWLISKNGTMAYIKPRYLYFVIVPKAGIAPAPIVPKSRPL